MVAMSKCLVASLLIDCRNSQNVFIAHNYPKLMQIRKIKIYKGARKHLRIWIANEDTVK